MNNQSESNVPNIPEIFLKPYDPSAHETNIYKMWEDSGYFNPDVCIEKGVTPKDAETYSMVLPPPNVTGTLHMGSALMLAVEDILIRKARMEGKRTLWLPGTDSAAIATQARVEKEIQKNEKKSRHDLGREELLKRVDIFVEENKNTILSQMKSLGASLDWSRYAYTMDEQRYKAVMEAFVRMYNAGLIYRQNRIVNWDPKGQTTISDDEIVHEERKAKLYTFKYSQDFPIPVATTRLETKVGDTAVAVHPDDERYQEFIGKEYDIVFCDVPIHIKIIADTCVEKDFGTGALGVTPAHSMTDWEIADRHDLPRPQIINEYAKMTVEGRLNGLKTTVAREEVVNWLKEENLLLSEEEISQNVSTAERTGGIIEPLPKLQWWIDVDKSFKIKDSKIPGIATGEEVTFKELMEKAVTGGGVKFVTERFEKIYLNWAKNLRPWCISRQIWFGHRIPVWYKVNDEDKESPQEQKSSEIYCGVEAPKGDGWKQEEDVLDTWFSSGLWTFTTLGWPNETADLKTYHPTTLIETGHDIIFFWVARMILMSGFFLEELPFKTIYMHGLVRDGQGRKISKSLGNNIDPVDMAAKYGMDAVRVSLIMNTAPGTDSKISEDKIRGYKHFANKLWNISRFSLTSVADLDLNSNNNFTFTNDDLAILEELKTLISTTEAHFENYRIDLASDAIYHYVWHRFADEIIEESKPILQNEDNEVKRARQFIIKECLLTSLKLLHPFMPFVTEKIWQEMPSEMKDSDLLMVAKWPTS